MNLEKYEVHVVSGSSENSTAITSKLFEMGFHNVVVSETHPRICSGELYSYYSHSKSQAIAVFNEAKQFMENNQDIPLLLEMEVVPSQLIIPPNPIFSRQQWVESKLDMYLSSYGNLPTENCNFKVADIHISLPVSCLSKDLEAHLSSHNVTFIKVIRFGTENIPGGCEVNEEWIAYTMQFSGSFGAYNANAFYNIFAKYLSVIGGFSKPAILKLEKISGFFITRTHNGIPSINSEIKMTP